MDNKEYFLDEEAFEGESVVAHSPFAENKDNDKVDLVDFSKMKKVSTGTSVFNIVLAVILGNIIALIFGILSLSNGKKFIKERKKVNYDNYLTYIKVSKIFNIISAVMLIVFIGFGIYAVKQFPKKLTSELSKYGITVDLNNAAQSRQARKSYLDLYGLDIDNNVFPIKTDHFCDIYNLSQVDENKYTTVNNAVVETKTNSNGEIYWVRVNDSGSYGTEKNIVLPSGNIIGQRVSIDKLLKTVGRFKTEVKTYESATVLIVRSTNYPNDNYFIYKVSNRNSILEEFQLHITKRGDTY